MTAPIDLEALRAALAAGPTPGPWRHDLETYGSESDITMWAEGENYIVNIGYANNPIDADGHCIAFDASKANASYIAACDPTTIGALVAELTTRRARDAEVEKLADATKKALMRFSDMNGQVSAEVWNDNWPAIKACRDALAPFPGDKT